MYEQVKTRIVDKFESINKFSQIIGVANTDLYSAFTGKKPMYPKYKKLIAAALNEDISALFPEEK